MWDSKFFLIKVHYHVKNNIPVDRELIEVIYPTRHLRLIKPNRNVESSFSYSDFNRRRRNDKYREYNENEENSETEKENVPRGERKEARSGPSRKFMDEWEIPQEEDKNEAWKENLNENKESSKERKRRNVKQEGEFDPYADFKKN